MAVLTAKARKAIPKGDFAIPSERAYPINDKAHARNALSRVAQHGSPSQKKQVRTAVAKKYPDIGDSGNGGLMNKAKKK
jgi:hypothetical protein